MEHKIFLKSTSTYKIQQKFSTLSFNTPSSGQCNHMFPLKIIYTCWDGYIILIINSVSAIENLNKIYSIDFRYRCLVSERYLSVFINSYVIQNNCAMVACINQTFSYILLKNKIALSTTWNCRDNANIYVFKIQSPQYFVLMFHGNPFIA